MSWPLSSLVVAALALAGAAHAAPVTYRFSTATTVFGGPAMGGTAAPAPGLFAGGASGSFVYDAQAQLAQVNADGTANYRGYLPASASGFATAVSDLAAQVAGHAFSDPSGSATVGNDATPTLGGLGDLLSLQFDPDLTSPSTHNLSGFSAGGFTLYRVRMFWLEGQANPATVPDFLGSTALPAVLPDFAGRLALDFFQTGNPAARAFMFFDDLRVSPVAVPEPPAWALSAAALALLGLGAGRCRRRP